MIIAFWLFHSGDAQKALTATGQALKIDRPLFDYNKNLVDIIKWSEVDKYITPEFWFVHKLFERFKKGFGLPGGRAWDEMPEHLICAIETLNDEYLKLPQEARKWQA